MFADFFARYLFNIIGGILISLMVWGLWHKFTHHWIDKGIAIQKVETDKVKLDLGNCKDAYKVLAEITKKQTDAGNKLAIAAKQAQKRRVEAIKKSEALLGHQKEKITALQASTQSVGASQGSCVDQLQDLQGLLDKAR
mgnify:CR=1 FL=1